MFEDFGKRLILIFMVVCLLGPIALIFWNPQIGAIAFLIGLAITYRCVRLLRMMHLQDMMHDQQALQSKQNHSHTILVQLIDDYGNDLPPEIVQEKLAIAQLQAGPRDTVIGVRRKVP